MSDKNYFKTIYENRKTYRSKEVSDELAEREVLTLFNLLSHFYKKTYSDQNNTVIDIGCGDAYLKKFFEQKNFKYIGYDLNDLDIEKDRIPLEDSSVDIVINIGLIEALTSYQNTVVLFADPFQQEPDNSAPVYVQKPEQILLLATPVLYFDGTDF